MARLPFVTRESVPEKHRAAYDEVAKHRDSIARGPISIMINSPEMARRSEQLLHYLHQESSLTPKVRQLAMLITAREMDCRWIWYRHVAQGRKAGLSDALVNAIRDNRQLPPLAPEDSTLVSYCREVSRAHKVGDATFQAALRQLGPQGLTELTTLLGYYTVLAYNANAFAVDVPEDGPEPLLPV